MPKADQPHTHYTKRTSMGIEFLGRGVDWWNQAVVYSLAVAAFAAFTGAVATWGVVQVQKRENEAAYDRIELLRMANLKLELQIQPRRLSSDDSSKLSEALAKMPSCPYPIGIVSRFSDVEASDFADDLSNAFSKGNGLQQVRLKNWITSEKGVAIAMLEGTVIPESVSAPILDALKNVNINATITTIRESDKTTIPERFQPNALYLLVGVKP
jgi:hypothetical protein